MAWQEQARLGSFQVHRKPLLLVRDARAPQRFEGWRRAELASLLAAEEFELLVEESEERFWMPAREVENPGGLEGLVWVLDRLLGPGGCPWDREQTHETLGKHLLEECYELLEAIESGDSERLKEELGDVLMQPLMHAEMERAAGRWGAREVAETITRKLVGRHPHVFGDVEANDAQTVLANWDRLKLAEKRGGPASLLAGIPKSMPALLRADLSSKRVARNGFEWDSLESVWSKHAEECSELREAWARGDEREIRHEVGDLLFTAVQLARWMNVEPEDALRSMLDRFTRRFEYMEWAAGKPLRELSPQEWDELWSRAKSATGESG